MSFIRMAIHTRARVPAHKYVYTCDALVNVCFGFHTITRNTSTNLYLTLQSQTSRLQHFKKFCVCVIIPILSAMRSQNVLLRHLLIRTPTKSKVFEPRNFQRGYTTPSNTRYASMIRYKYHNAISSTWVSWYRGCTATPLALGTQGVIIIHHVLFGRYVYGPCLEFVLIHTQVARNFQRFQFRGL